MTNDWNLAFWGLPDNLGKTELLGWEIEEYSRQL